MGRPRMRTGSARRMVGGGEGGGSAGRQLGRGYYVLGQKLPLAANRPEQGALQLKETSTGRGASRKPSLGSRRHKAVRPACGEGGGACICPSEEGCHLPPDLTATSGIRTRDPNTGPQVSKAEPILPQAQNSCHLHVSHALVTRLSAILVGGGGAVVSQSPSVRTCGKLWIPHSFNTLILPTAPKASLVPGSGRAPTRVPAKHPPSPSFPLSSPRSRVKGKRMLICSSLLI